jgi:MFS family permease
LIAVYLKNVIGIGAGLIVFVDGVGEAMSYVAKLFSGVLSDYLRRRKVIMIAGYVLMVLSRPVFAMSSSFIVISVARMMERIGNGIQATARDALVGDVAPPKRKGACYGLKRTLATAGSFMGGFAAMGVMLLTHDDFVQVFWIATIPAVMSILILFFLIKEPKSHLYPQQVDPASVKPIRHPIHFADLPRLGQKYWFLMVVSFLFTLARFGEAVLILHANQNFSLPDAAAPLVMILYNAMYSLTSFPMGKISDRMNRYLVLALGMALLIVSDVVLFRATSLWVVLLGVALWGMQIGVSQGVTMALIADLVPEDLRGTAFGMYYFISSIASVLAGAGAGSVAQIYGLWSSFLTSCVIAFIGIFILLVFMPRGRHAVVHRHKKK